MAAGVSDPTSPERERGGALRALARARGWSEFVFNTPPRHNPGTAARTAYIPNHCRPPSAMKRAPSQSRTRFSSR